MPLKCGSASTDYHWYQVREIDRALATMDKFGIDPTSVAYQKLWRERGAVLAQVGTRHPKSYEWLTFLAGESPGTIQLGHDSEYGWFSEARVRLGAPPIYHRLTDEEAMAILREQISPELHDRLFTLEEYYGE